MKVRNDQPQEPIELARLRVRLAEHKIAHERATSVLADMQNQIDRNSRANTPEFQARFHGVIKRVRVAGHAMKETQNQIKQLESENDKNGK